MSLIEVGAVAPPVPGVEFGDGPVGLFFYKDNCPTCQMAAPKVSAFERAYPGRVVGVAQDPPPAAAAFSATFDLQVRSVSDVAPYPVSDAYGIESVPTLILVGEDGRVVESVGAWDREGFNRVSSRIAEAIGVPAASISTDDDGLPGFKPG